MKQELLNYIFSIALLENPKIDEIIIKDLEERFGKSAINSYTLIRKIMHDLKDSSSHLTEIFILLMK